MVEKIYKYKNLNNTDNKINFEEVERIEFQLTEDCTETVMRIVFKNIHRLSFWDITLTETAAGIKEFFEYYKKSLEFEPWTPKVGETYWCADMSGKATKTINTNHEIDHYRIMANDVFQTQELAEKEAERQIARGNVVRYIQKANKGVEVDFGDWRQEKYYIATYCEHESIEIKQSYRAQTLPKEYHFLENKEIKKALDNKEFMKDYKILMGWE